MRSFHHLSVVGPLALVTLLSTSLAESYNMAGTNVPWTTATSWNPNIEGGPTEADSIVLTGITGTRSVTMSGAGGTIYTVSSLSFNSTGTAEFINPASSGSKYLVINQDLTVDGGGNLNFQITGNSAFFSVEMKRDLIVNSGIATFGSASNGIGGVIVGRNTTVASSATLNIGLHYGSTTTFNLGATQVSGTLNLGKSIADTPGAIKKISFNGLTGAGTVAVGNDFTAAKTTTLEFLQTSGKSTFTGSITEAANNKFAITHAGGGHQVLTGAVTYSGVTNVTAGGVLQMGDNTATAFGTGNIALSGGNGTNGGSILGLGSSSGTFQRNLSVTVGEGAMQMSGHAGFAAYGRDQTVAFNSAAELTWASAGFFTSNGVLVLGHSSATNKVTFTNGVNLGTSARTILVHKGSAQVEGSLSGVFRGTGGLTKEGSGTLEITAANTYSGVTTISAGKMLVNNTTGSATGTGTVSLASGATLGGGNAAGTLGFISGVVTTAGTGSVIAPGTEGVGVLTLSGGLNATSGASFEFQLGTQSDQLSLGAFTGSTTAGNLQLKLSGGAGVEVGTAYTILTYTSASGLDGTDFSVSSLAEGMLLDAAFGLNGIWLDTANKRVQVQFEAVPEPSFYAFLAGGIALIAGWGRRRSRLS